MSRYISETIRKQVVERAHHCCEYCLIPESETYLGCEVDHIISLKHGGATKLANLAFACFYCNRNKGSDIGSVLMPDRNFVRFFDPRIDQWQAHFQLSEAQIIPITEIGKVTATILEFNHPDRIMERLLLIEDGCYPPRHIFET